jgi:hexosaminidase
VELPVDLDSMPPGPRLGAVSASLDLFRYNGYQLVEILGAQQRQVSYQQARLLAVARELTCTPGCVGTEAPSRRAEPDRFTGTEIAFALSCTEYGAQAMIEVALTAVDLVPALHRALAQGRIDLTKVRTIVSELALTSTEHARVVVDKVVAHAHRATSSQLRAILRRALVKLDPDSSISDTQAGTCRRHGRRPSGGKPIVAACHHRGVTITNSRMLDLVPAPVAVRTAPDQDFRLGTDTRIIAAGGATVVGEYLADVLRPPTGLPLPVVGAGEPDAAIELRLDPGSGTGEEHRLRVEASSVLIVAGTVAGLFAGAQTLRQLLPPAAHSPEPRSGPWDISGGEVVDRPRFGHRGAMLDVSRHFFTVEEVKRFVDQIALYKLNVLHLHLTDDQGWRIEITSWPKLATVGGATQVGGGPGGYYTQAEFRDLVGHAAARGVTVIPEIDVPGHTNAALTAYAELNPDGMAVPPFIRTGNAVGFSSLCTDKEITYRFIEDVFGEVAALTPGEYVHIGTDEAHATPEDGYATFVTRVLETVARHGKRAIGWHELLRAAPPTSAVPQYWGKTGENEMVAAAVERGGMVLLSPSTRAYLDMKYNPETPIGFKWAAYIDVADAYGWDPGTFLHGVPEQSVLGLEAPLWTETVATYEQVEYMAFPRLPAIAELGWSPRSTHDWPSFARRLATHGPRWEEAGVGFYRSTQIPWPATDGPGAG